MAQKKPEKKRELNENVKKSTRAKVIAALEEREASGKIGPNDKKRLAALRGESTTPVVTDPANPGADDNIDTETGRIFKPEDLLDEAGKLFDPNDPYWNDIYKKTYDAQYGLATSGLAERQAREVEEARQIAAERGLPYDPAAGPAGDPNTAYGKQVGGVYNRYDQMYSDAANAATLAAQDTYATQGSLANDSYIKHIQAVLGISEAEARAYANELTKRGIDKDYKAKMAAIAAQSKRSGGGGGGGGVEGGSGAGFDVEL